MKDTFIHAKKNKLILPVALRPIRRSPLAGKQIGAMCGANSRENSKFTKAKSYSYVKKLYFG